MLLCASARWIRRSISPNVVEILVEPRAIARAEPALHLAGFPGDDDRGCCRLRSVRASRCSGVPARPNIRSNTARGLISIGSGVVGELHEIVLMYAQLNPLVHAPDVPGEVRRSPIRATGTASPGRSAVRRSDRSSTPARTSSASVRFGVDAGQPAGGADRVVAFDDAGIGSRKLLTTTS